MLLAQKLQAAGLNFLSAKARHRPSGLRIEEVVCDTEEDVARVKAWATREKVPLVVARLATKAERETHRKTQEFTLMEELKAGAAAGSGDFPTGQRDAATHGRLARGENAP